MNQFLKTNPVGAWLNLARIANLPTAWANILMGFWLSNQSFEPNEILFCLIGASSCFYVAGMILNDVFDYPRDLKFRPERPIPAGQISLLQAKIAGFGLLIVGVGLAFAAAAMIQNPFAIRIILVGLFLPIAIIAYDYVLKKTILSPIAMGLCRSLNILLGASAGVGEIPKFGYAPQIYYAALTIGLLICGVTWFARFEAIDETAQVEQQEPKKKIGKIHLWIGAILIAVAFGLMNAWPYIWDVGGNSRRLVIHGFLLTVAGLIFWRVFRAIRQPKPNFVQRAVVTCLFSLILLDATFVLMAPPQQPVAALMVAILLVPTNFLGKFFRPT